MVRNNTEFSLCADPFAVCDSVMPPPAQTAHNQADGQQPKIQVRILPNSFTND